MKHPSSPMPEARHCPQCGRALDAGAPAGLCPACLLRQGAAADTLTPAGTAFEPPTVAEMAEKFPQLEIIGFLGRGGMGAVYKARQRELDRVVALKILPPAAGDAPSFTERFTREARALAKLNHPNIVTLYEFGQAGGLCYFLMEYVDGVTLRELLAAGRLSAREALAIVPQICDALQFAHDHHVVHRDIKPENLLMDRRGRVKVADFGLAKIVGGSEPQAPAHSGVPAAAPDLTNASRVIGTPSYMSPEQLEHPDEVDHRADIYALGVVFYQMLTGELPGTPVAPPSRRVQVDVRLDEVVLRALERQPQLRFQQASAMKTQVETISDTTPAPHAGPAGTSPAKSGMVRLIELYYGTTFVSPLAIRLINLSALGFLGSLGFLGYLGGSWRGCFRLFALAGCFGLIGVAFIVELGTKRPDGSPHPSLRKFWTKAWISVLAAIAIAIPVRTFLLGAYVVSGNSAAPELPAGSHVLVWKLSRHFAPGDMITYDRDGKAFAGRVVHGTDTELTVSRNGWPDEQLPVSRVIGKVVSVYWRGTSAPAPRSTVVNVRERSQQGWMLFNRGSFAEAAVKFREALAAAPDDADALTGSAWCAFNTGSAMEAERGFRRSLELNPNQPGALNGLGQLCLARRDYPAAESFLLKAADQGATAAWFGLAKLELLQARFEEAEKWARRIEESGQGDATVKKMLEAAKAKHLSEGLRALIEPPAAAK